MNPLSGARYLILSAVTITLSLTKSRSERNSCSDSTPSTSSSPRTNAARGSSFQFTACCSVSSTSSISTSLRGSCVCAQLFRRLKKIVTASAFSLGNESIKSLSKPAVSGTLASTDAPAPKKKATSEDLMVGSDPSVSSDTQGLRSFCAGCLFVILGSLIRQVCLPRQLTVMFGDCQYILGNTGGCQGSVNSCFGMVLLWSGPFICPRIYGPGTGCRFDAGDLDFSLIKKRLQWSPDHTSNSSSLANSSSTTKPRLLDQVRLASEPAKLGHTLLKY